jgi:hypothetical protein
LGGNHLIIGFPGRDDLDCALRLLNVLLPK